MPPYAGDQWTDPVSGFSLKRWISGILTAFVAPAAIRVDDGDFPYMLQPFAGTAAGVANSGNPIALAGSGSGSVSFQIPNNCQIEVDDWKMTSSAITTSTTPGAPLGVLVQVMWNGNQTVLTPYPTPAELIFASSAAYRSPWSPRPWIVTWRQGSAGSQASFSNLTFQLTNQLTTTNTIYTGLVGWNRIRGAAGN